MCRPAKKGLDASVVAKVFGGYCECRRRCCCCSMRSGLSGQAAAYAPLPLGSFSASSCTAPCILTCQHVTGTNPFSCFSPPADVDARGQWGPKFPYMAALYAFADDGTPFSYCSGTVISASWVLTSGEANG